MCTFLMHLLRNCQRLTTPASWFGIPFPVMVKVPSLLSVVDTSAQDCELGVT